MNATNYVLLPIGKPKRAEKRRWWEWIFVIIIVAMAYALMGSVFFSLL